MGIKSDCFGLAPVEKRIQRAVRPCRVQRGTFGLLVVPTLDDGLAGFLQIGINVYRLAGAIQNCPNTIPILARKALTVPYCSNLKVATPSEVISES